MQNSQNGKINYCNCIGNPRKERLNILKNPSNEPLKLYSNEDHTIIDTTNMAVLLCRLS